MGDRDLAATLKTQGIRDQRVLDSIARLSRADFLPEDQLDHAQENRPLPIGCEQTASQPYIVAFMTEALHLTGLERVLEIGTGSGYQTAVLAQICSCVYSIEVIPLLAARAKATLARQNLVNVFLRLGNGTFGWPEAAPFDAVLLTAAPERLPADLFLQLREGGRLVAPVGKRPNQQLIRIARDGDRSRTERLLPVQFVPMIAPAPSA